MWYQSKTMPPNQNGIQKWRMVLFCSVLRRSTGWSAFQLQLLHHASTAQQKGMPETTGELSTPSASGVKGHRLVFVEAPSLLEHSPPLSLQPLSCRQENGCSAWAKSSKAGRKKKQSFSKGRGGEWVSCLIHHSSSGGLAPPPRLQYSEVLNNWRGCPTSAAGARESEEAGDRKR